MTASDSGPPEPRANPLLLGHAAAEAALAEAARAGRMHHAWLITGPRGVGKATLAYRFARALLAGMPDGGGLDLPPSHPVFRRVAAGAHADLRTLTRTVDPKTKKLRGEIVVDDVRAAGAFLRLTPAEGGWRVLVVDAAEELNRNAANALLKMLEEPPQRAVLLLVCNAPGRLLPTIRSRCRRLRLDRLDDAAMDALLARYLPDLPADERGRLVTIAEGAPGRALMMAEEEGTRLAGLVDGVLSALPDLPLPKVWDIADGIGRDASAFSTFMDLLRAAVSAALRDALRGRADPDQARLADAHSPERWAELWSELGRIQDETRGLNLDTRQAVIEGLTMLASGAPAR
ncbi:MAG TPA: DNA polymerase III subunit delta' [Acidisphaera sp.]|nr:DNA polymerase III subunit delta' [Acidisphaera sp.]